MVVGMFYAAIGGHKCQLVSVKDIGTFGGMALLDPDSPHFHNTILDLSGGNYDISDVRQAVHAAQGGGQPWFATYTPKLVRRLLPYDFKQMMICEFTIVPIRYKLLTTFQQTLSVWAILTSILRSYGRSIQI